MLLAWTRLQEGERTPKTNADYWIDKLRRNKARDLARQAALEELSWRVLVVWECEIKDREALVSRLKAFLDAL